MPIRRPHRCVCKRVVLAVALLVLASGCASQTPEPKVADIEQQHLSFIRDGATSREQVLLQLGIPSGQFEGDRIMTWRLRYNGTGLFPSATAHAMEDPRYTIWTAPAFNLVLVFDARNLVQKHSLIEVR